MSDTPAPEHYSPRWQTDLRTDPPTTGEEAAILSGFLDWHRATFELKCAGLQAEQCSEQSISPSGMSLHGLLRHLAGAERWWFRIQFAGESVPLLYYSDAEPAQDFEDLTGDPAEAMRVWHEQCVRSREIVAAAPSLDAEGTRKSTGEPFSLRWLMLWMIAEYARHNGHADLLRERVDGATGL